MRHRTGGQVNFTSDSRGWRNLAARRWLLLAPARRRLHLSYSRRRSQKKRPEPLWFPEESRPLLWRGVRDLKIPGRGGATCRRGTPFVTKAMRPGIFLSIVEFTPGDTRPRESAWVLEMIWRREGPRWLGAARRFHARQRRGRQGCTGCTTRRTPRAAQTRRTVSKRGALSGRSAL